MGADDAEAPPSTHIRAWAALVLVGWESNPGPYSCEVTSLLTVPPNLSLVFLHVHLPLDYSGTKFEQDLEKPESIMLPCHHLEGFLSALSEFECTILNPLI